MAITGIPDIKMAAQVAVLTRDAARLARENNALHVRLIEEGEAADARDLEQQQQLKACQEQVKGCASQHPLSNARCCSLASEQAAAQLCCRALVIDDCNGS